jgi:type IV pilus assembly protein PilA
MFSYPSRQRGQGMTEYIIVVALIAVAAIAVYQLFGQVVRSQTAAMARELAGEDGTAQSRDAKSAAEKAAAQTKARSLKSFTGNAEGAK